MNNTDDEEEEEEEEEPPIFLTLANGNHERETDIF